MKAEKTHALPSASWRTRKAGSIIQSKSKGLRIKSAEGQGQKMDVLAQERAHPLFLCLFVLLEPSVDCVMPAHTEEGDFLHSVHQLIDAPSKNVLPTIWASCSLVKLSHEINHHALQDSSFLKKVFPFGR